MYMLNVPLNVFILLSLSLFFFPSLSFSLSVYVCMYCMCWQDVCTKLWCRNSPITCATDRLPAVDGTSCGLVSSESSSGSNSEFPKIEIAIH